jgi:transcription elongation GreA/GreB family factor
MSRAFVKESDGEEVELPERPISRHPNLVTPEGLAQMDATLARLRDAHARALTAADRAARASIGRDLRYWTVRRSTAQLMPAPSSHDKVQFGSTVTILRDDGRRQTYRIVGEDEAEPVNGTLSLVCLAGRPCVDEQGRGRSDHRRRRRGGGYRDSLTSSASSGRAKRRAGGW